MSCMNAYIDKAPNPFGGGGNFRIFLTKSVTSATIESSSFSLFIVQMTRAVTLTSATSESSSFSLFIVRMIRTVTLTSATSESSSVSLFLVQMT